MKTLKLVKMSTHNLPNAEHFQFHTEVKNLVQRCNPQALSLRGHAKITILALLQRSLYMNKAKSLLLAVAAAAMAFTVSCFPDGGSESIGTCGGKEYDTKLGYSCVNGEIVGYCKGQLYYPEYDHCENGEVTGGTAISSSSLARSSSGSGGSSPSGGGYTGSYGSVQHDGKAYKTVKIGTQTWMAENLSYNASGSKCFGEGGPSYIWDDGAGDYIEKTLSPSEAQSNCATYGRLYNWATAMNLPSSCNSNTCSSQIQSPHKGICPSGWHIPNDNDWSVLMDYVGGYETAGKYLKATSGWYNDGNGTDKYGFSALPGGYGRSVGSFYDAGFSGFWWSASVYGSSIAYGRGMSYDHENARWLNYSKSTLFSVRCLQD